MPVSAQAPESRAEALRQERAEKASALTPYKPSGLERAMTIAEDKAVALIGREGFYPKLGSLTTGSGFAFGAGFRNRPVFKYYGTLDLWTAASLKGYWAIETRAAFPDLARGHRLADAWATRRSYPQEHFVGIGPDARRTAQVSYSLRTTGFGARGSSAGETDRIGSGVGPAARRPRSRFPHAID